MIQFPYRVKSVRNDPAALRGAKRRLQMSDDKSEKEIYEKPELKKEGELKDITAGNGTHPEG